MRQTNRPKVLVVDDEPEVIECIRETLSQAGIEVAGACDGREGLHLLYELQPDAVVLDITLPDIDGWEICRRIRLVSNIPIILLAADANCENLVQGLNMGADDYMSKPFSLALLQARIESLFRRTLKTKATPARRILQAGDIKIDLLNREVFVRNRSVHLSPKEFDLLACLVRSAGRTVPHEELLRQAWGAEYATETQHLSIYIWYLRNRIEEDPRRPQRILTWRGLGYRFVPVSQAGHTR